MCIRDSGIGLRGIDGRSTAPVAGGVFLEGAFQFVGDTDVIDHQPALLVLENAIDPRDGLHQVMALHRLVDVQRMHAWRIDCRLYTSRCL